MIKNCLFAVALLSLALAGGCAKGGNGLGSGISVAVSDGNLSVFYVTQVVQFTAKVTGTSNTAVTWSLTGTACTGSPNPCGTLDANGKYTAPANAPNPAQVTVTATSQADTTKSDSLTVPIKQITVQIAPNPVNVGIGLTEQFTAVVVPDDAPQNVTWTIQNCTGNCGSIDGTGKYTAPTIVPSPATFSVQAAVPPSLDPSGFNQADGTIVKSRFGSSKQVTTYAFRFSGFDITGGATALAGNFVVATDGRTITSGVEDELTTSGWTPRTLTGLYTANSNNEGTITLNPSGTSSNTYTVVLDANGDIQMIESDSNGKGSGVIEQVASPTKLNTGALLGSFVLGFTGMDISLKRVGYAAFLTMDGAGCIGNGTACSGGTPGFIDINDDGTASSGGDVTGSYTMTNGIGTMQLKSATLNKTFNFDLYGVGGQLTGNNPLTLYAISTDQIANNPAVSGMVVFQDPKGAPYNNAAFKGTSVSSLTGVDITTGTNANVALTVATTDGSGNISGTFDQNNAGTIVGPAQAFGTGYKYAPAGCTGCGRYTVNLLGNPTANPPTPMQFILYATGANRGFLLDQSSKSVMTGTMNLQLKNHTFGASEIAGTYAAAATSSGTSGVDPIAANLLLTWVNTGTCTAQCVNGTQYVGTSAGVALTGAYTITGPGDGTITLTTPAAQSYVIYAIDVSHFLMMDVDKSNTQSSIIFAQQ
jgi:hypothetical protein